MTTKMLKSRRPAALRLHTLGLATLPLVLPGCASLSGDSSFRLNQQVAEQHLDQTVQLVKSEADQNAVGDRVAELLAKPLSADATVQITKLVPDYMVMGERGMADMGEMEMPLLDNTVPMMTGKGPFGGVEMGGMFSILKVRKDQKPGDYSDPGWYQHPKGEVAFEWTGALPEPARFASEGGQSMPRQQAPAKTTEVTVRKPTGHSDH